MHEICLGAIFAISGGWAFFLSSKSGGWKEGVSKQINMGNMSLSRGGEILLVPLVWIGNDGMRVGICRFNFRFAPSVPPILPYSYASVYKNVLRDQTFSCRLFLSPMRMIFALTSLFERIVPSFLCMQTSFNLDSDIFRVAQMTVFPVDNCVLSY